MTLDDMRVLHGAVAAYREAATAAGIAWPAHRELDRRQPPELVYRLFDVEHLAEQLIWLQSQGWHSQRLLPDGGWLLPWPTDAGEAFDDLSFSMATPFLWRHQLPLFHFEIMIYSFVLAGPHEGEIWRYEFRPDTWDSVRAATSLAALFTEWTKGIAAGVVFYNGRDNCLHVGDDEHIAFDVLQDQAPNLDPFAFPASIPHQPQLRARQRECGVDMDRIDRLDAHEELLDAIAATRASLRM